MTGDVARDRRALWLRVIENGLVPAPDVLAYAVSERVACGERVWSELVVPRAGELVFDTTVDLRRIASAAYGTGLALYELHGSGDDGAGAAEIAMWLTLAAAELDHLVDDGILDGDAMRRFVPPGRVLGALAGGRPVDIPGAPWATRTLELGLGQLGGRMRAGAGTHDRELCGELQACIRTMLVAQLRSDELAIGPHADLARVRADLRAINALTVWIGAYAGLLDHPVPEPATLETVRRVATLFGELGWALDALSDIHEDLDRGVFSLVWLELAEHTGTDAAWLVDHRLAPVALAASPVIERILVRCAQQLAELDRQTANGSIARLAGYMVAAFLYAEES